MPRDFFNKAFSYKKIFKLKGISKFMTFDSDKRNCLQKMITIDKSRKQSIDNQIIPILNLLNKHDDFYTTSSCSGRIYLLTEPKSKKKHEVKWLFVSHIKVNEKKINQILSEEIPKDTVWLRQEGMILHIACRTIESANEILDIARTIGFRRSGIIADNKKIIVEICSTEKMDVPISDNKKLLVDRNYIRFIIKKANKKLESNNEKMNKFNSILVSQLK